MPQITLWCVLDRGELEEQLETFCRSEMLFHHLIYRALSTDLPKIPLAELGSPVSGTCEQKCLRDQNQELAVCNNNPSALGLLALDLTQSLSKLVFRVARLYQVTFRIFSNLC